MFKLMFFEILVVCSLNINLVFGAEIDKYLELPSIEIDSTEFGLSAGKSSTNCSCGWTNPHTRRIVGGKETGINQFPFVAGLAVWPYGYLICGASIITPYHSLTAAHCTFDEEEELGVVVGEHNTRTTDETDVTRIHKVKKIIEHENYDKENELNDIALLVLEKKIEYNKKVGPSCLPTAPMNLKNQIVKVLGWGRLKSKGMLSKVLRQVNLRVIPLKVCAKTFAAEVPLNKPNQICTFNYGKDSCQGDSGGPVVWLDPETNRYIQVGLVSYGSGCGSDSPGVNTDLGFFNSWIQAKISETNPKGATCSRV